MCTSRTLQTGKGQLSRLYLDRAWVPCPTDGAPVALYPTPAGPSHYQHIPLSFTRRPAGLQGSFEHLRPVWYALHKSIGKPTLEPPSDQQVLQAVSAPDERRGPSPWWPPEGRPAAWRTPASQASRLSL